MFLPYIERLKTVCQSLSDHPDSASPMGRLVCAGLHELIARAAEYDAVISTDFLFKKHFLELVTSLQQQPLRAAEAKDSSDDADPQDGSVLQLFEDLALFARVRSLRLGMNGVSKTERDIMTHFESCGMWQKDDETLVCRHYWYDLPMTEKAS